MTTKRFLHKAGRMVLYIIGVIVLLVCVAIFFTSIPFGKRIVKNQVQSYLSDKLKTKVVIGAVDYRIPSWVEIKNVYIEDQRSDTLLYGEQLTADVDMFKLLRGNTDIKKLLFKNIFINISRKEPDTAFNFQFVINAFTGNKPTNIVNPDTAALKLTLDRLVFDNVGLRFKDELGGNSFVTRIKNLDATLNKFQPDRLQFGINKFYADSVSFFMNATRAPLVDSSKKQFRDSINAEGYDLFITSGSFQLREVNVTVDNKYNGMFYSNHVQHLGLTNAVFDMHRSFTSADSLLLDSSSVRFTAPKKTVRTDSSSATPWVVKVNQLSLLNNEIQYDDLNLPAAGGFDPNHLNSKGVRANIRSFTYSPDSTAALVDQLAFKDMGGFQLDSGHARILLTDTVLSVQELYVRTPNSLIQRSVEIRYDSIAGMTRYPQNSTVAANLNNSILAFNDLYLLMPSLKKTFPPAQFANLNVKLNTELRGSLKQVYLPYLQLSGLNGSTVSARGHLYNLTDAARFSYDLEILDARIKKTDLLKFIPPENHIAFRDLPADVSFSGHIIGDKNRLTGNVNARGGELAFQGKININNISDPLRLQYDLDLTSATVSRNFIMGFIPPGSLPPNIHLPERVQAAGLIKGDRNNVVMNARLKTSYGAATVKGYIKNLKNPKQSVYDLFITTNAFDLGRLLGDTSLGIATMKVKTKGTGFDYTTMRSDLQADISQIVYNRYNYTNAVVDARFNNGLISAEGNINDENLAGRVTGDINVRGTYPLINAFLRIDTARLQALHLYDSVLNLSTTANIRSTNLQPRSLDGSVLLDSIKLQVGKHFYSLDTVALVATSANGIDDIRLRSELANLHVAGGFDYDKIGNVLLQYVDRYYNIIPHTPATAISDQQLSWEGEILNHPLVKELVPGLQALEPITFNGSFASSRGDSALSFKAAVPYLAYQGNNVRNGNIDINSRNEKINYAVTFDTLHYIKNTFYGTSLTGSAAHDSLDIKATTQDNRRRDWFGMHASVFVNDQDYYFRLKDQLLLNYESWSVAPDNFILYSPKGIQVNNFTIRSDTASIVINSRQQVLNSPIDIAIDNFNLKSISSLVSTDTLFTSGIMDARLTVSDLDKKLPGFTGNAQVTDLHVMNQPLGNASFTAQKQSDNNIAATLDLAGYGNDIHASGNYYLNSSKDEFDATMDIRRLNFKTVEGFSAGTLKDASGNIHGNLVLNGKFADPHWNGTLNFDTTRFSLTQFNTPYKINNQKITLAYPEMIFRDFTVLDSMNNKMDVNGTITSRSLGKYDLNLDINAVNFIVIDAPRAIDNQYFGYASVNAFVLITGTSEVPEIEGDIFINDESDLTIVLPETSYNADDAKTVVRFIDRDTFNLQQPYQLFEEENTTGVNFARFLNYNLGIGINKNAKLTIIVDPVSGDEIMVQGDAQLTAGVDPGGHLIFAGNYNLDKGYYVLNYQFLQRRFNLMQGSTIAFSGEPMKARIDITAEYIANTSARDLLTNEVGSVDRTLANSFNQKFPFRVILNLTGILSKPTIKFDIQLPDENTPISSELRTTIENKLLQLRGDEAAINKQVFSLLLLNRFVGEQSSDFFKGNGNGFSDLARQSVSQFLSGALNEIAGNIFKGIDIDLNLNSYQDYRYGGSQQRTDLNVALSKSFLDDRLIVSVGTNIGIEGQDPAVKTGKSNNNFMPNVSVSYKLTKDGKYMIRGYRRNQFEVVLDGYVVQTGLGFVITMEYDKFRELFSRKK